MPIEIRELVVKAPASDRDADGTTSAQSGAISDNHAEEELAGNTLSQADTTTEAIIASGRIGDSEMAIFVKFEGVQGDVQPSDPPEDTLDLDLSDADPGNNGGESVEFDSFTLNFEPIKDADDDDTGFVSPDLALTDVNADDYGGDTMVHEIGHWLG